MSKDFIRSLDTIQRDIENDLKKEEHAKITANRISKLITNLLFESDQNVCQIEIDKEIFDFVYYPQVERVYDDKKHFQVSSFSHSYNKGRVDRNLWTSKDAKIEYEEERFYENDYVLTREEHLDFLFGGVNALVRAILGVDPAITSEEEEGQKYTFKYNSLT